MLSSRDPASYATIDDNQQLSIPMLAMILVVSAILGTVIPPLVKEPNLAYFGAISSGIVTIVAMVMTQRSHSRLHAKLVVTFGMFLVLAVCLLLARGNLSMEPSVFMFVLAISGLLFSPRTVAVVAGMAIVTLLMVGAIRIDDWMATGTLSRNLAALLGYTLLYLATTAFLCLIKSGLIRAWDQILVSKRELAENNAMLVRQIVDRERAEQMARERSIELGALFDISNSLSTTLELKPLLEGITRNLREIIGFDAITISELSPEGRLRAIHAEGPDAFIAKTMANDGVTSTHFADIQQVMKSIRPVIIQDIMADTLVAQGKRERSRQLFGNDIPPFLTSSILAPLINKGEFVGLIFLNSARTNAYDDGLMPFISAIASLVSASIQKSKLHDKSLQAAALGERSRIARELHDSVSQSLFGITLGMRTVMHTVDIGEKPPYDALEYVSQLAQAALNDTRALVFELRPEYIEKEGLIAALKKQASTLCARHNINIVTMLGSAEPQLSLKTKEALYRIALEAIQNTIKHAEGATIRLSLVACAGGWTLEIRDDGRGFDPHKNYDGHFGLKTMHERALDCNAQFSIDSAPGRGTSVRVQLPSSAAHIQSNYPTPTAWPVLATDSAEIIS